MSWKSFACVAALSALAAPAVAQPSIDLSDTGVLSVIADATGSLAAEISVTSDLALSNVALGADVGATEAFDTPNPGDNPLTGGETTGLYVDEIANGDLFISYGSAVVTAGTYELLTFDVTGTGTVTASGIVAQLGVNSAVTDTADFGGGGVFGDFEPDGDVDIIDFGVFADAFDTVVGDAAYLAAADSEPDGDVDIIDFGLFADNFLASSATSVPEPASALMVVLAGVGVAVRSRR